MSVGTPFHPQGRGPESEDAVARAVWSAGLSFVYADFHDIEYNAILRGRGASSTSARSTSTGLRVLTPSL
ncbi:MAG: hypothetical protein U0838_10460 [Chloroflexota bacterium]